MALAQNDIIRISARMKHSTAGDVVNVYHARLTAPTSDTDAQVMTTVQGWLDTIYSAVTSMSDQLIPYDVKIDLVERQSGKWVTTRSIGQSAWTVTSPPGNTGEPLPSGVTAVINFRTGDPHVIGRKYLGVWDESFQDNNVIWSVTQALITTAIAGMLANISFTSAPAVPGIVSAVRDGLGADGFYPLVEGVLNTIVGYMRRRKPGTGS